MLLNQLFKNGNINIKTPKTEHLTKDNTFIYINDINFVGNYIFNDSIAK